MIFIFILITNVTGFITQSRVEDGWTTVDDIFDEGFVEEEGFCGLNDGRLTEIFTPEDPVPADSWSIDDFDDSIGWREGDGLQLRAEGGDTWDTEIRYYRPENSGLGKFGSRSNGTLIGMSFPTEPNLVYPANKKHPLSKRSRRQARNLMNMLSDWSHGCIKFVDVMDPKYSHRVTQGNIRWQGIWRLSSAYAGSGGRFGGCSVNFPYWGRVGKVIMHEIFHCIGQPHTTGRDDYMADCEKSDIKVKHQPFTRHPYHSVMYGPSAANKCDLEGAEDNSIEVGYTSPASAYDVLNLFPVIEGVGHCDQNTFKAMVESNRCASRGPLPYRYPLMENRRCDMMIDCPYEDVNAPPSSVDEGPQCMKHYCCDTYKIQGMSLTHPFAAKDTENLLGTYKRLPELYHGQTPIWKLEGSYDIYLYKENIGGNSELGYARAKNWYRLEWSIGIITNISDTETEETAFVKCVSESAPYDWCPHRIVYCRPNEDLYDEEDLQTKEMAAAGVKSVIMYDKRQLYSIHIGESRMTFDDAKEYCHSLGMRLIRSQSPGENDQLLEIVDEHFEGVNFWMGISDEGDEGNWTDIYTGRELIYYMNWDKGEPNNYGNRQHHAHFEPGEDGHWGDTEGGSTKKGTRAGCMRAFDRSCEDEGDCFDLNDGDHNYKFLRSEFEIVCHDEKFKALEAEKYPWLDKKLDIGVPEPINPDDFEIGQCRSFENWTILENTGGGFIDKESKTTDLTSLKRKAVLLDDAVGIVKAASSSFYFLSLKKIDHFKYEHEPGTTFFKKPALPCEICPKSVGWQGYNINDHTICHFKPNTEDLRIKDAVETCSTLHNDIHVSMKTWHGEKSEADWTTEGGIYQDDVSENMFDDDEKSMWHSNNKEIPARLVKIEFKNEIQLAKVVIRKRKGWENTDRYDNVCLVLDGVDFTCFDKSSSKFINWDLGRKAAKQIRVEFRHHQNAMIADLKIMHWNIQSDHDEFLYQLQNKYRPALPVIGSFDEKRIWIKITEGDAEKKKKEYGESDYGEKDYGMWLDVLTKSASDDEIKRHREVLTTRNSAPDAELEFFDMVKYRSWDAHPESLKKKLDKETFYYYFRYWYPLAGSEAYENSKGFWQYSSWIVTRKAAFCSIRFKSATLEPMGETTTTKTTTTTTKTTTTTTSSTTTTAPPTPTTTTASSTTTSPDHCKYEHVRPIGQRDECARLESDARLNMKGKYSSTELVDGTHVSITCAKGHLLNLYPEKKKTAAYCRCENGECNWKFSKGDVMCVPCQTAALQGKNGRAIQIVNEWATGILIVWRVAPYKVSNNGWSVALKLAAPLESDDFVIHSGALDVTGVSAKNEFFTFTPKPSSPMWDATTQLKTILVAVQFENVTSKDITTIKKASNFYYKYASGDQSCAVDRFECYPLKPNLQSTHP